MCITVQQQFTSYFIKLFLTALVIVAAYCPFQACSMFVTVFSAVNSALKSALYRIEISPQSVQTQPLAVLMSSTGE
ncbi:hypothetical protein DPMN_038475 [Dreissena polymorpha]|uniref:Uncharacterized protein n=1 Tax=Dreissena polymorpha TaxID=45954 RepID=A0A9D4MCS9_DREPO|nr:hypothetical protein DPMN_038475 [Dreissena polymorpha]